MPERTQVPRKVHSTAAAALLFLAPCLGLPAPAQQPVQYQRTPVDDCFHYGALRSDNPDQAYSTAPMPHVVIEKLNEAVKACEQAVVTRSEGPLLASLARLRLLAGDGKGALEAANLAAEKGSVTALVVQGVILADGVHVRRDHAAARQRFLLAAKKGDSNAHFNLGVMLANGWGGGADEMEAAAYLGRAAIRNDPVALQVLAQHLDRANAPALLRRAAEILYPEAAPTGVRLAFLGRLELDRQALLDWYEQQASAGEPWANAYLGILHESGQWVAQDFAAAAERYRTAGLAGNAVAQGRLSSLYRRGLGVPESREEAVRWGTMWQVRACEALEREEAKANACDRYAGDPYDPQKVTQGMNAFCMRHFARQAVTACAAAVASSPSNSRFRAQYARSLAHTGDMARARQEARAAAAGGSSAAMVLLGAMDQRGLGGPTNPPEALRWYRKASDAGNPRGAALVAMCAMTGVGVARDSPEAQRLLEEVRSRPSPASAAPRATGAREQAIEHHNRAVQLEQARRYDEALAEYTAAAGLGWQMSAMNVAQMYEKGIGVPRDDAEAARRYRQLAEAGSGEARYRLAGLATRAGDYEEARRLHRRNSEDDDYRSLLDLGQLVEKGLGGPKDGRQAAALYERAAPKSTWAKARLGAMYLEGDGVAKDYAKARGWLQRAAGEGDAAARNNLGQMHDKGLGVPVDYAKARAYYLAALRGGNVRARGNLEEFFESGRGAPKGAAALDWYRGGAEARVMSAQYRLGQLYLGSAEIARNEPEALRWFLQAADQGHAGARSEAATLLRAQGKLQEAVSLGDDRAIAEFAAKAGDPVKAAQIAYLLRAMRRPERAPPNYPRGVAPDPAPDPTHHLSVRAGNVGAARAAAGDAALADPYQVVAWFPETDGKTKGR